MMVENICGQPMPSPHSGSLWSAQIPSLPFQRRWLGKAETERSHQICGDLSVSLRLTAPLGGEPFRRQKGAPMRFIYCLCYAAGLGVVSFVLGRLVPKEWFDYTRFPYRSFAFEKGGKIYEAIGIAKWQSRVPDMSRIFPKLMPAKRIPARPDEQTLLVMIRETCAAEATHALLILAGLGLLAIWPGAGGILLYLIYAIFGNLVFLIIQRYNRPRLVRLYERMCAKRSKEA